MEEEDLGGIDKDRGHPRALQIIPDEFFWDCADDLAPFGSDEGDTALSEYRDWRKENPDEPLEKCLIWTIESVGEIDASEYSDAIFHEPTVRAQIEDPDFDDQQLIYTTDAFVAPFKCVAIPLQQLTDWHVAGRLNSGVMPHSGALRMSFRKVIFILLVAASSAACGQSVVDRAEKDELYLADSEDADMKDAFRRAQLGLEGFLSIWRNPPAGITDFSVKVGVTEGENTEYFWITPFREESGTFIGTINNEPQMVTSVKLGGEISFTKGQVVDWLYYKQGKMVGNYTACAMLKKEPESERHAFEQRFGLRCGA